MTTERPDLSSTCQPCLQLRALLTSTMNRHHEIMSNLPETMSSQVIPERSLIGKSIAEILNIRYPMDVIRQLRYTINVEIVVSQHSQFSSRGYLTEIDTKTRSPTENQEAGALAPESALQFRLIMNTHRNQHVPHPQEERGNEPKYDLHSFELDRVRKQGTTIALSQHIR